MGVNYAQIYAIKAEQEKRIEKVCPGIPTTSGIYVFYRTDEADIKRAYCGQAVNLRSRCAQHLGEHDHIALSLKKHKFYSPDNPHGWKLHYITCSKEELDEKEVANIKSFADAGYQMYNILSGGGAGRTVIGEAKPTRNYHDGLKQGRRSLAKELKHIIDTHLNITLKKETKTSQKALQKFNELLEVDDGTR